MTTQISDTLDDSSNAGLSLELIDSNGNSAEAAAIDSIIYTWSNVNGNIINGRINVSVNVANPVLIELDETDTKVSSTVNRLLTVTWIYNDTVLGINTQKVKEFSIEITNFINV